MENVPWKTWNGKKEHCLPSLTSQTVYLIIIKFKAIHSVRKQYQAYNLLEIGIIEEAFVQLGIRDFTPFNKWNCVHERFVNLRFI